MPVEFLRTKQVLERLSVRHSTLRSLTKRGLLTEPLRLSKTLTLWPAHEIEALVNALAAGADQARIAAMVERMHRQRANDLAQIDLNDLNEGA